MAAEAAAGWGPQQGPSGVLPESLADPAEGDGAGTRLLPPHLSCSVALLSKPFGHLSESALPGLRLSSSCRQLQACYQLTRRTSQELAELGLQAGPPVSPEKLRPLVSMACGNRTLGLQSVTAAFLLSSCSAMGFPLKGLFSLLPQPER